MFESYFNLCDQPFGATPDPRFLLRTGSHREALASLYAGFYANRGFTVLIADPGMGKTTLLFEFLDHIRGKARTVFLFDTVCEPTDFLSMILLDLGLTPAGTGAERHHQLNEFLAAEARADRKIVLVIDEAQNLSLEALEAVRLLSNFETSRSKLMQVILSGQPQLAEKLARPEVLQLRQRVSTICRLAPLNATEATAYVEHRLKLAGHAGAPIFNSSALKLLVEASQGTPRVTNTLCFNSLCLCLARNAKFVDESIMLEAITDLQLPTGSSVDLAPPTRPDVPTPDPIRVSSFDPITGSSEVHASSRRAGRQMVAALLSVCISLGSMAWWINRSGDHFRSAPAALLQIWNLGRTNRTKKSASTDAPIEAAANSAPAKSRLAPTLTQAPDRRTAPKQITVAAGETLEQIARTNLGTFDGSVLRQIRTLNPEITDPNHIETGGTIRLPRRDQKDQAVSIRSQP